MRWRIVSVLNCVKHIIDHGLESLSDFGIEIKDYGDFILLTYSQIESPKFHPIVDECRGLILAKGTWKVLCRSFDRFYNYGEDPRSEQFPMNKASVTEKVDGSLIRFWWNPFINEWCAATRKMAFAEGPVTNGSYTFKDIIERALGKSINDTFKCFVDECKTCTTICELVSPETRIVKPYGETALYMIGMRYNETGEYVPEEGCGYKPFALGLNFKLPKKYTFKTWDECTKAAAELTDYDEGYVADWNDWRIKIKSPAYLAVAHLRNNGAMSTRRIVALVMKNDEEEYLSYFPEDRELFQPWIDARNSLAVNVMTKLTAYNGLEDQKEFALTIKNLPYAHILFQLRKGRTYAEIIERMIHESKASDSLISLLEKV